MSRYDYEYARDLRGADAPFYGLIMGAMMRADTSNAAKLRSQWPDIWDELQARYDAPGAVLPSDPDYERPDIPDRITGHDTHEWVPPGS